MRRKHLDPSGFETSRIFPMERDVSLRHAQNEHGNRRNSDTEPFCDSARNIQLASPNIRTAVRHHRESKSPPFLERDKRSEGELAMRDGELGIVEKVSIGLASANEPIVPAVPTGDNCPGQCGARGDAAHLFVVIGNGKLR